MTPSVVDDSKGSVPQQLIKPVSSAIKPELLDRLDQDFIEYYKKNIATRPVTYSITIKEMWENPQRLTDDDDHIFTTRIYHLGETTSPFGSGPYPTYINFHEIYMTIRTCPRIMVMDVGYRLAPENAFEKGAEDAWAAIRWVYKYGNTINARSDCIAIGGISAGGHMCAMTQQLARCRSTFEIGYESDSTKASD
ncbi:hypothetical protein F4677DRAFT_444350 [Hypoxylon crocopeplum]|nr:hypothetical protein F4677DRAFT_444350 [Hypoxylon crocopeplum]